MKTPNYKVKIGIVGCGAIGSRMAQSIHHDLEHDAKVVSLFDVDVGRAEKLAAKLGQKNLVEPSIESLIEKSDCVVEAINTANVVSLVKKVVSAKKSVLVMSVGKMLQADHLFRIARKNKCYILLPSGAIAGVDAIKAASLVKVDRITLTTRKPVKGLIGNPYFERKGIDLSEIKKETTVFEGTVSEAVKNFPQNINVGATIALASQHPRKLKIKLNTSPKFTKNTHEIELTGDFGRIVTMTENVICPDNPKTSYLAVLSGMQTLKQYCTGILIGT